MAIETDIPIERQPALPAASPMPPIHNEDEISLLDLLIVLARRKRLILTFTLGCGALGLIVSLILPKRFTAAATVLPPQQNTSASALASQLGSLGAMASLAGGSLGLKNPNDMYVAMFKSQTVEDAMIQRFG